MKYKIESSVNGRKFREEITEASGARQATQMLAPDIAKLFEFNQGRASVMIGSTVHSVFPMEL
jgi:hypothetical protein